MIAPGPMPFFQMLDVSLPLKDLHYERGDPQDGGHALKKYEYSAEYMSRSSFVLVSACHSRCTPPNEARNNTKNNEAGERKYCDYHITYSTH